MGTINSSVAFRLRVGLSPESCQDQILHTKALGYKPDRDLLLAVAGRCLALHKAACSKRKD